MDTELEILRRVYECSRVYTFEPWREKSWLNYLSVMEEYETFLRNTSGRDAKIARYNSLTGG